MKSLLLSIAVLAIVIAMAPSIRPSRQAQAVPAASPATPAPTDAAPEIPQPNYRNPLGAYNGGLGTASFIQGSSGAMQVYTLRTISKANRPGEVVRLRMSRPTFTAALVEPGTYAVTFDDSDGGISTVLFPAEGVQKLDLLTRHTQPGLTFYVMQSNSGLRAVGRDFRSDTRTYVW